MNYTTSILTLSLLLVSSTVLAHDPLKPTTKPAAATQPVDHRKMQMDDKMGDMPMDHGKMADAEFAKHDKNKDGKISKAEIPSNDPMAAHFGMLDTNKDGSLSKAEFAKHHDM